MHPLADLDHQYLWHPFTQMQDWLKREPIVIVSGKGAVVRDLHGREYLDANSSIWTNLHGHAHPKINAALRAQLTKISHSSALGLANEPAARLGARLVRAARPGASPRTSAVPGLGKVFFSDDGSTALEVALKLAYEFARRSGRSARPRFLSLAGAYHGDTVGAVSLGHIDLFHKAYSGLLFRSDKVPAPFCYRCRFNRSQPERADAREYRNCKWECLEVVAGRFERARRHRNPIAGMVVEPLMQGAAGMVPQPTGWLARVAEIVRADGAQLILDEVMTGFGRAVTTQPSPAKRPNGRSAASGRRPLFACQTEEVPPDFLAVAKGMTGGYLPMAATLTTQAVFEAFLGEYAEFKTFFHGHSFTGNQLGAAAALASLDLLESEASWQARIRLEKALRSELDRLWTVPAVGDIRQVGMVAGVELVRNWRTREPFPPGQRVGGRVCESLARRGVLTRPVGDVIVIMPPFCTTPKQVSQLVDALIASVEEVWR